MTDKTFVVTLNSEGGLVVTPAQHNVDPGDIVIVENDTKQGNTVKVQFPVILFKKGKFNVPFGQSKSEEVIAQGVVYCNAENTSNGNDDGGPAEPKSGTIIVTD